MAVTSITISCTTDAGSLDRLRLGIESRSTALGRCTSDSTVAASIMILRSLRAATAKVKAGRKSPVSPAAYRIVATDMYGGFTVPKGARNPRGGGAKICARVGSHYGPVSHIRPAIGFAPGHQSVLRSRVYAIYTTNPHDRFASNVNRPAKCWYVLCEHEGQAVAYAEAHIRRIYSKESGMAKYAIAIAQAKASTRSRYLTRSEAVGKGGMSPRSAGLAYDAAKISINEGGYDQGVVSVSYFDGLNYSTSAAGGDRALASAIDKASDAMVYAYAAPEIKQALRDYRKCEEIHRDLAELFRRRWLQLHASSASPF